MKRLFLTFLLTITMSLWLSGPVAAQSLAEAARMAARQNDAKVLSARTVDKGERRYHEIKVLTRKGVVKTIRVPAPKREKRERKDKPKR